MMIRSLIVLLTCLFSHYTAAAQNLTGTWEGILAGDEKIKVCIRMRKKEICGFTADYVIQRPSSYCKANFRGWFDKEEGVWVLVGTGFIENSGDHILMVLRLWHQKGDPSNILRGTEEPKYGSSSLFNSGSDRGSVRLKKVSSSLPEDMPDCFPEIKKPAKPLAKKEASVKTLPKKKTTTVVPTPAPVKPVPEKPKPVIKPKPVPKLKDTAKPVKIEPKIITPDTSKKIIKPNPVPVSKDISELLRKMNARKKTEFSRIVVHDKNIILNVYDNGVVDNDTVSIFYNGKLIAGKKGLSEKAFTIKLELDENASIHEIVMFAENLGSIPPNTALIVVTAGNKRYELHSSASLTENAVLTFEYVP